MKFSIILLFYFAVGFGYSQNNIVITDNETHEADPNAVLDIYSTSKGILIPRMTTEQINLISNPVVGLLVFNTDVNSFWFYNDNIWDDLSSGTSGLWTRHPVNGHIYLNDAVSNVGIGTSSPVGKLSIQGNTGGNPDNPLFEVNDEYGNPVFTVTSEGVRVYIKDFSKGSSGGFAVGRYGIAKDMPDTTFLIVTSDSTRVYTRENSKGASGGFAVGRYGIAKGLSQNYLQLSPKNYFIGHQAGSNITSGLYNIFLGYESGLSDTTGAYNTFVGYRSGQNNSSGGNNVFLGYQSGHNTTIGWNNIFIGTNSGIVNETGSNNIYIGVQSGPLNQHGSNNIFIGATAGANETGSNKFYLDIDGQDSQNAMMYGEFDNDMLRLNGLVTIGNFFNLDTEVIYPTPNMTLDPTRSCIRFNSSGIITLNTVTAIGDGKVTGQILVLLGSDETKTVTVPNNANTMLTSSITLDFGDVLMLIWDGYQWRELSYTNM
jgi:hypothetical protein